MILLASPIQENLYIPVALKERLAAIFRYPLTVVAAPSGSGKTTAVRAFLNKKLPRGALQFWYTSFGESRGTAWNKICGLFANIDPQTAASLQALEFPTRETLSETAERMQDICCDRKTVVVIDNYQLIKSSLQHEVIAALSQHGNDNLHIVVITQQLHSSTDTLLSMPRIFCIDTAWFLFSNEDVADYFKTYGIDLTDEELHQVMDNTAGWISALRLQLLNYQQTGEIRKEHGIEQLFHHTVWAPLEPEQRRQLLLLTPFDSVNVRQICIMLDTERLPEDTARLLSECVFIEYNPDSRKYIIHNILREFLSARLEELSPGEKNRVYLRAGRAYLYAAENMKALKALLLSGCVGEALSVPLRNADMVECSSGEIDSLLSLVLAECPRDALLRHPQILLVFAFELYLRGNKADFRTCAAAISEALQLLEDHDPAQAGRLRGEYAFLMSFTRFNDLTAMCNLHKKAKAALGGPSTVFDFNRTWTLGSPSVLYQYWRNSGELDFEIQLIRKCMTDYLSLTDGHGTGGGVLMRAEATLHMGRPSDAEAFCHEALYLADAKGQDCICFGADLTLARIAILRGDAESYHASLSALHDRMVNGSEHARRLVYDQCQAWLSLLIGETGSVPDWLLSEKSIEKRLYGSSISFAMMIYGKLLLFRQDYSKLIGFSRPLLERAGAIPLQLARVYILIYLACAKLSLGAQGDAVQYLQQALAIALPDKIYLPFAEHGMWLEPLLSHIKPCGKTPRGADKILRLWQQQKTGVSKIRKAVLSAQNTLTLRELEIAGLAKQGLTNKEIAEALFIAPETVKMALKKIFQKLGIHSRYQLVDKIP